MIWFAVCCNQIFLYIFMFAGFGYQPPKSKQLTIHFILNGHPERLFTHTFVKSLTRQEAEQLCDAQWGCKRSLRFFSLEGVELVDEELEYVRNNQRIYVSRGEQFDSERNFGEYTLIRTLGEGGFGRVWLAKSSITGEQAAIKLIKLEKITGARDIDMVFREVENLKALTHPNIVKILNCYTLSNMQLVVVMEYLPGGELLSLLKAKSRFTEGEARRIFGQIVAAVAYCHRENIIHRDLKLENILVADKEALKVKVADFGISGVADTFNPDLDVGTLRYMAPEVLSKKERINTAAVDVWACGVMLFCMIYGHLPFVGNSNSQTIHAIVNGEFCFPARPIVTQHCKAIISSSLQLDPRKRISAADLQLHPWMSCDLTLLPEEILPELPPKPKSREKRKHEDLKRTVVIPKRLEKQKQKLLEQLKNMGSKRKIHHSEAKPLRVGSQEVLSPRYKLIKTKEEEFQMRSKEPSVLRGSKQEMRLGKDEIKMGRDEVKVQQERGRGRVKKRVSLVHVLWR